MTDPRWLEAVAFIDAATASDEPSAERTLELIKAYFQTIENIAADALASDDDRDIVRQILDEIRVRCRMLTGKAISVLAEVTSVSTDPRVRDEAARVLHEISERMREQGHDISQWVEPPPSGKPQ
jgi:hypothetical protein